MITSHKDRYVLGVALALLFMLGIPASLVLGSEPGAPAELPQEVPPPPQPGDVIGVLGPDGDPVTCATGEPLMVKVPGAGPQASASANAEPLPNQDPSEIVTEAKDSATQATSPELPAADGYVGWQERVTPLVPICGVNGEAVWEPLGASDAAGISHR